jgi:membrane protein implicated in regulation of membrane protease activity
VTGPARFLIGGLWRFASVAWWAAAIPIRIFAAGWFIVMGLAAGSHQMHMRPVEWPFVAVTLAYWSLALYGCYTVLAGIRLTPTASSGPRRDDKAVGNVAARSISTKWRTPCCG